MEWPRQRLQTEYIRRRPIENEKYFHVGAKLLSDFSHRRLGVRIVPIGRGGPIVNPPYGLQYLGMHRRVVVTGKTPARPHVQTI